MKEIIIKEMKVYKLKQSIAGILMTTTSIYLLNTGIFNNDLFSKIIVVLGAVIFTVSAIDHIIDTIKTYFANNIIKITDEGIIDSKHKLSLSIMRWDEIKSARISKILNRKFVCIELKAKVVSLDGLHIISSGIMKLNKLIGFEFVNISIQSAEIKPEDVVKIINENIKRKNNENNIHHHTDYLNRIDDTFKEMKKNEL